MRSTFKWLIQIKWLASSVISIFHWIIEFPKVTYLYWCMEIMINHEKIDGYLILYHKWTNYFNLQRKTKNNVIFILPQYNKYMVRSTNTTSDSFLYITNDVQKYLQNELELFFLNVQWFGDYGKAIRRYS